VTGVTAQVADGQALPFADGEFEAAFSMFGLMFFPDRAKGFAELRRTSRRRRSVHAHDDRVADDRNRALSVVSDQLARDIANGRWIDSLRCGDLELVLGQEAQHPDDLIGAESRVR